MERGSDKHSPRIDESLREATASIVQGSGIEARAEEFREQEGPADGEAFPSPGRAVVHGEPGMDSSLSEDEVNRRADLARHLPPKCFPARPGELVAAARAQHAPDSTVALLEALPDHLYANVAEAWTALGGHLEHRQGTDRAGAPER